MVLFGFNRQITGLVLLDLGVKIINEKSKNELQSEVLTMFDLMPFGRNNSVNRWFDEFERSFWPDFFKDSYFDSKWAGFKTDIIDNGKEYLIEAELAGFNKEDINIEVNGNRLTISAKKDETIENKDANYIRKERHTGQVMRSFAIDNVQTDGIRAEFIDGVLKLVLPKLEEEKTKVRRIDIN